MTGFRYPQFCALARALEVLGSRWTLLIIRDLISDPRRFSDLQQTLAGISSSVLAERLAQLEEQGIVKRRELPPPAASTVYELTETGRSLEPVLMEMVRWGAQFLQAPEPGDHLEPDWVRLGISAFARRAPSPNIRVLVRIRTGAEPLTVHVEGGPQGTRVHHDPGEVDVCLEAEPLDLLALAAGAMRPADALTDGRAHAEGDISALERFAQLFDVKPQPPN